MLLGLTATVAAVGVAAAPARAGTFGIGAYLLANQPSSTSYTIPIIGVWNGLNEYQDAVNPGNGPITVTRSLPGMYQVRFGGLGSMITGGGGTVHVNAAGGTANFCTVVSWYPSGADLLINVDCFASSGARADTAFEANFAEDHAATASNVSYLWANQPTASYYTPSDWYRWDSTGGTATITRSGTGTYKVYLPASVGETGITFYQANAYGGSAVDCKVASYLGSGKVLVRCLDASESLVDSRFTLTYSHDLLQRVAPSVLVAVDDSYPAGGTPTLSWTNLISGGITVSRLATGIYRIYIASIANPWMQAVAYANGDQDARCHLYGWTEDSTTADVNLYVYCANSAGRVDTPFVAGLSW